MGNLNFSSVKVSALVLSLVFLSACYEVPPEGTSSAMNDSTAATTSPAPRQYYFEPQQAATGKKVFVFDPKQAAWAAYDETGFKVADGPASGGRDYCSDINSACRTPTGKFQVFRKQGADCVSSKFPIGEGGAPMPYCMFFNGGYAVHGSYAVPNYNASHGCVRVTPSDAQWLSENFMNYGTTVVVRPY